MNRPLPAGRMAPALALWFRRGPLGPCRSGILAMRRESSYGSARAVIARPPRPRVHAAQAALGVGAPRRRGSGRASSSPGVDGGDGPDRCRGRRPLRRDVPLADPHFVAIALFQQDGVRPRGHRRAAEFCRRARLASHDHPLDLRLRRHEPPARSARRCAPRLLLAASILGAVFFMWAAAACAGTRREVGRSLFGVSMVYLVLLFAALDRLLIKGTNARSLALAVGHVARAARRSP